MIGKASHQLVRLLIAFWAIALLVFNCNAGDTLQWGKDKVSADIKSAKLGLVLKRISSLTGWKVYVEPETSRPVSAKFQDLPPGQALRMLLGDLNFALAPGTNGSSSLYVYRTGLSRATQLVTSNGRPIPNEVIV